MCELRTAVCVVIVGLALAGCSEDKASPKRVSKAAHGLTVELPPGWRTSSVSLTPYLSPDPKQVLAAANYPLRYRPHQCAHIPVSALEDLGQGGAFVELEERRDIAGDGGEFPARPEHFDASLGDPTEASECVSRDTRMTERSISFSDQGRHFYARVAFGPETSKGAQDEAWGVLDSLKVDPEGR